MRFTLAPRALRRATSRGPRVSRRRARTCWAEALELRCLLSLNGTPTWANIGPTFYNEDGVICSGSIQAVAVDPRNADRVFIASSGGGVWRTTNATAAAGPTWVPLTDALPFLGTSDVVFDPLDPTRNTIWVGTGRVSSSFATPGPTVGLYKSTNADAGPSEIQWTNLGQDTLRGLTISTVLPTTIMESGKQVILVATKKSPSTGDDRSPSTESTGLYRSADGGQSWDLISGRTLDDGTIALPSGDVSELVLDPSNPTAPTLFAALPGLGVFRSVDGGKSWTVTAGNAQLGGLSARGRIRLAIHPDAAAPSNDVVYVGVTDDNVMIGLYRSDDAGASWKSLGPIKRDLHTLDQASLHVSMVADPTDPNVVYVGGDSPGEDNGVHYRVTYAESGNTWESLDGKAANETVTHTDSRNMVFDRNGDILEVDDGGIFRLAKPSDPRGRKWSPMSSNLTIAELTSVAYDSVNHVVFGGSQDNGSPGQGKEGDPTSFTDLSSGDGEAAYADNTSTPGSSVHYTSPGSLTIFRSVYDGTGKPIDAGPRAKDGSTVVKFTVSGAQKGLKELDKPSQNSPFALNAVDPKRMLIGAKSLYESFDSGMTLTALGGLKDGKPASVVGLVRSLAYGGFQGNTPKPDVAYAGVNRSGTPSLLLRTERGKPFVPLRSYPGETPQQIVLDPDDWRVAYVLDSEGKVWRTADASASSPTFTNVTSNLGSVVTIASALAVFRPGAGSPPVLFVGGQGGVAATDDPTASQVTWVKFGAAMPHVLVTGLVVNSVDNVLVASTFGRGFWKVDRLSDFAGDQAPVLTATTTPLDVTFTARAGPVSIVDPSLEVTDPDQTMIYQATITLLNPTDGSFEKVQVDTSGTKITAGAYQAKSGILELSGLDTLANYQNVLRTATYDNVGEMIDQAVRTITITVGDGVVFSNRLTTRVTMKPASPSAPQTDDEEEIVEGENTFVANGDPLRVAKRLTVRDPDSTLLQSATVTLVDPPDADEEVLAVDTTGTAITALYDPESAVLVLVGADTPSHYQQVLNTLTYDNLALLPDARPRQVEIVVSDGTYEGLVTSITFTITTVNHAPILQPGSTFTLDDFDEIAPRESVVGTWVGDLLESGVPGDAITDIDPNDEGGIAVVGVDNTHGTWEFSTDGGETWEAFDDQSPSHATLLTDDLESLIRFVPSPYFYGTVSAGLLFRAWDQTTDRAQLTERDEVNGRSADTTLNGGDTAFSTGVGVVGLVVNPVNQQPRFDPGTNVTRTSDGRPHFLRGWAMNASPGAPNETGQTLWFEVTNNNNAYFLVQPSISPKGDLSFTPVSGAQGTATVSVRLRDDGGIDNGGKDTSPWRTFTITLTVPAPVVQSSRYVVPRNGRLIVFGPSGLIVQGQASGAGPLRVQLLKGPSRGHLKLSRDGAFLYLPFASFLKQGRDRFTFRVIDAKGRGSGVASVTLVRQGARPAAQIR